MQGARVSRPILSVIRLTESGKDVIFKKNGGIIRDTKTGVTTTFRRKHGIYVMGIWVNIGLETAGNPNAGFARRARAMITLLRVDQGQFRIFPFCTQVEAEEEANNVR